MKVCDYYIAMSINLVSNKSWTPEYTNPTTQHLITGTAIVPTGNTLPTKSQDNMHVFKLHPRHGSSHLNTFLLLYAAYKTIA